MYPNYLYEGRRVGTPTRCIRGGVGTLTTCMRGGVGALGMLSPKGGLELLSGRFLDTMEDTTALNNK